MTERPQVTPRIDIPEGGFYQTKLVKDGPFVAVRIWFGFPTDLDADETTDRAPSWQAEREGKPVPVDWVWPDCSDKRIPIWEYMFLLARAEHAREHDPDSPFADPRRPVDMLKAPPPVFRKK